MIGTRESIESELRKREGLRKVGGNSERVTGERFLGDDDLDDERDATTLKARCDAGHEVYVEDGGLELTKAEGAYLGLLEAGTGLAKTDAPPGERVVAEERLREGRRVLGHEIGLARRQGYASVVSLRTEGGSLS